MDKAPTDTRDRRDLPAIPDWQAGTVKEFLYGIYLRYVLSGLSALVFFLLRHDLPFVFPALIYVALAHLCVCGVLHTLAFTRLPIGTIYRVRTYADALVAFWIMHYSGGFLSPLLLLSFVLSIGRAVLTTRFRQFGLLTGLLNFAAYLSVATAHKFGILANQVEYSRVLMVNEAFFWYVVSVVSCGYLSAIAVIVRHQTWHQREMQGAYEQIVDGTSATIGEDYLHAVTEHLARALGVRCSLLTEFAEDGQVVVRSAWPRLDSPASISWADPRLAIQSVVQSGAPQAVGDLTDETSRLIVPSGLGFTVRQMAGVGLIGGVQKPLGAIWVFHDRSFASPLTVTPILRIVAARSAAEFGRRKMEQERAAIADQACHLRKLQAVGQLAGGISHDFNNIVQGVMGYVELLKKRGAPAGCEDPWCRYIERITVLCRRASDLTSQLLAFSSKGEFQLQVVDVGQSVTRVASLLRHTLGHDIRICLEDFDGTATVFGDPATLENAFLNMGLNARDAMPNGGTLTFALETRSLTETEAKLAQLAAPGDTLYVAVRIADTGVGMTDEVLQRIFEPFYTTRRRGEGAGLGLSSAFGCIRQHNGFIAVTSSPGQGSAFTVCLPFHAGTPANGDTREVPPRPHRRANVLVVDDERDVMEIMCESIEGWGGTAKGFTEAADAVEYYRGNHEAIDVVMLDMQMPGMDGRQTLAELRKISPSVRSLFVSGYGLTDGTAEAGTNETWLRKPVTARELIACLQRLVDGK